MDGLDGWVQKDQDGARWMLERVDGLGIEFSPRDQGWSQVDRSRELKGHNQVLR